MGSATIQRLMHGLKVTVTLSGSGRVTLRLRDGRRTLATRRIAFSRAGRRVVLLRPSKRLAKTLRHATRLKATLTATIAGASAAAVSRHLVLRR